MEIRFLGAAREVGRSAFLLETGRSRVMLDYGVKLDHETEYPLEPKGIVDSFIISHAHLDHSGYLPNYYSYTTPVSYMTPPTLDLSVLLWTDFIKVAGKKGEEPPFAKTDIRDAENNTIVCGYRESVEISDDVVMEFFDAGHIPGAAMTKLYLPRKTLLYTGDFKLEETRMHGGADLSDVEADVLIMESTYADRDHPNRKKVEKEFVETVRSVLDNGGHVILPSFAVGRSQELVEILVENKVDYPIFLDGMARDAARIILRHPGYVKDHKALARALKKAFWIKRASQRKRALEEPSVIVTTAGMLQGGPVYEYLSHLRKDPNSMIVFTGYQVEDTPGRQLLDTGTIPLGEEVVKVEMQVKRYDFSAHAGRSELFTLVKRVNPEKIFVVHGDEPNAVRLAEELTEMGYDAVAPRLGETHTL